MQRLVLDTVVFVRALLNRRSIWVQVVKASGSEYQLIVSRPILDEMDDVLVRPEMLRKYKSARGWDVQGIMRILRDAEIVVPASIPATCRDPKDDKFLAASLAGHADYLITEDDDLLVLERFGHTRILTATAFREVRGSHESSVGG